MNNTPQSPSPPLLSLFVACYNEHQNIAGTLSVVRDACSELNIGYEIILIDDASTDESIPIIRMWIRDNPTIPIYLIENSTNQGLAQNFITAARLANGEWFRLVCGDNVEPKETLITIFRHIGQAELLLPYHTHCCGKRWFRKLISYGYTWTINILSGYRVHYYNGLLVTRRKYIEKFCHPATGFAFQADLVTQLLDLRVSWSEIGVETHERVGGIAKAFAIKNFFGVALTTGRILKRRWNRLKGKIDVALGIKKMFTRKSEDVL